MQGFNLHAAMRCDAPGCKGLEQLCRCIIRPAPAKKRVRCYAAEQAVLKRKTVWRDGTAHPVMLPLEFMHWLAALAPRPGLRARSPGISLGRELFGAESRSL